MARIINCLGMACPKPVMATRDVIAAEQARELSILVDNEAAVENVSRFLTRCGYKLDIVKTGAQEWTINAEKTQAAAGEPEQPPDDARTLVLITSETMGIGDPELGAKLMQNFLATLPELGPALWRIVLLNGGVKLSAKPGACLEHLQKLASDGVSILVCGTCLTHYGLMEQKQVGETTNMLDIVTSMAHAAKIIHP